MYFFFQRIILSFFFFSLKTLKSLKFSIFILFLIGLISSLGSFIEQDQDPSYYEALYPSDASYAFLAGKIISVFQLNHIYQSWYFHFLLILLSLSLSLCSFYNQFPLLKNSKNFLFDIKAKNFQNRKEFFKDQSFLFETENILLKTQKLSFYLYQNKTFIYAYKALIGRISPIFVHLSLILLLLGAFFGAFENFQVEEMLAKGEITYFQNVLKLGKLTTLPRHNLRVNDFWASYQNQKIKQFYSNLSLINSYGKEELATTISVNQPLMKQNFNCYQSDWDFKGIRLFQKNSQKLIEYALFPLSKKEKIWLSWISLNDFYLNQKQVLIIFDQLQNTFFIYNEKASFVKEEELNSLILQNFKIVDLIKRTGLLIKYDASIPIIYLAFFILIFSSFLSFLPYQRLCIFPYKENDQKSKIFILFSSNRNTFNDNIFLLLLANAKKFKN